MQTESGGGTDSGDSGGDTSTSAGPLTGEPPGLTSTDSGSGGQTNDVPGTTGDTDTTAAPDPFSTDTGETTTSSSGGVDSSSTSGDSSDSDTGDEPGDGTCPLALMHQPCDANSDDVLHALGINCADTPAENFVHMYPEPIGGRRVWQVARAYGDYIDPMRKKPLWGPWEGEKVLLISTGLLPAPDADGVVTILDDDVYHDSFPSVNFNDPPFDDNTMPPPMNPAKGSPDPMGFTNCDGVGDCSNTLFDQWQSGVGDAEDKTWFSFDLTAPAKASGAVADANGYSFDFAFFSAEFPEYVGSPYNDIFVVWQASENYTGNVVFIKEQPLTVTALWPVEYKQGAPALSGTGFSKNGGGTAWYRATGGVNPGETFTLAFAIFDMSDSIYDTTAILDNFQWDCDGCVPNEIDSCGIAPM
ncbi:MAG TPA: choice-of-anchor L domain-containing protein [Nannocystis sp.]